jgi:hypothetical protein
MARVAKQTDYEASKIRPMDVREQRDIHYGRLKDYGKGYNVEMFWDLNDDAKQDQIFKIQVRGRGLQETIDLTLDKEELLKYLRWV